MMPQGGSPMGQGMPPEATGGQMQGGNRVDMQQVLMYFQQAVQSLVASGLPQEQAITKAMEMVAQKFGPEAAQQLMLAAQQAGQGGDTQAPMAPGPEQYGPSAPGSSGMV